MSEGSSRRSFAEIGDGGEAKLFVLCFLAGDLAGDLDGEREAVLRKNLVGDASELKGLDVRSSVSC